MQITFPTIFFSNNDYYRLFIYFYFSQSKEKGKFLILICLSMTQIIFMIFFKNLQHQQIHHVELFVEQKLYP